MLYEVIPILGHISVENRALGDFDLRWLDTLKAFIVSTLHPAQCAFSGNPNPLP